MRVLSIISVVAVFSLSMVRPQAQSAPLPQFDVASVKRTTSERGPRGISFSPSGRFAWNQMTLKQLMASAYAALGATQIVGGPDWLDSTRFDVVATSPDALKDIGPDGSPRGLFIRLRALLEDRFALTTHVENRVIPVYALEPAAAPFVAGPKLRPVDVDCDAVVREAAAGRRAPVPDGQLPLCSLRVSIGHLIGRAATMTQVGGALAVERPVVDRSGLTGAYDVDLSWAPDFPPGAIINGAPAPPSDGPSIFTAVREQLGLRLEPTRASVPVLVVDSAQLPTPD